MKILIVSLYMPPSNTMGALRVGKLCKFLDQRGHDVMVLSADRAIDAKNALELEFSEERIIRTKIRDINWLPKAVQRIRVAFRFTKKPRSAVTASGPKTADEASSQPAKVGPIPKFLRWLSTVYQEILNFPDLYIGWLLPGIHGGKRLLKNWQPDIVVASGPPFTTALIGRILSDRSGVPLVMEYRDRFYEDPYTQPTKFRKFLERKVENWWMKSTIGIVTVSEPWANDYLERYRVPVCTVYNGFEPEQFPIDYPRRETDPDVLRIVYTGILYPGTRDPSPLFEAISMLGDDARFVRVAFFSAEETIVTQMANRYGVMDNVEIYPRIPYAEAIDQQMNADVLLLLQWNDPKERGNVPGKLFEYLASRRPILGLGYENGVPAQIIRKLDAGVYANEPDQISQKLREWIEGKRRHGNIPLLSESVRHGFSRAEQYETFEEFLMRLLN